MPLDVQRMIRGVVHDELLFECPEGDVEDVRQVVSESMSFEWCPEWCSEPMSFTADCGPGGKRWSETYD